MSEQYLEKLIKKVSKLPGLGPRSSRRVVLHLLKDKEKLLLPLIEDLTTVANNIRSCMECGNLDENEICQICKESSRNQYLVCVVETVADLWALERAAIHKGKYHVLGGTLSAIDGVGPDDLGINSLIQRANDPEVEEIILALNATIDGQTTAYFITDQLKDCNVKVSRLAHGVPVGGELDYMDDGTLQTALQSRQPF